MRRAPYHHADDRRLELLLQAPECAEVAGVAGNDDGLTGMVSKKRRDLAREGLQVLRALLAGRKPGRVADVGEALLPGSWRSRDLLGAWSSLLTARVERSPWAGRRGLAGLSEG